jgi:hypothetical protein
VSNHRRRHKLLTHAVSQSITSYGNRANDYETVVNYFRAHFLQVHRKNNEKKRVLYSHLTNVVVSLRDDLLARPLAHID